MLCAKGFTSLLAKAENDGKIQGASICRGTLKVSNLLFANDSLLFYRATQNEVEVISEVLQTYANALGQCINLEKSSVFFSSNNSASQKQDILRVLGVQEVNRFDSYLGLPTLVGRTKYHMFSYLKDRIWKKLQGWKGKMLSRASKEILSSCSVYSYLHHEYISTPFEAM